MLGRTLHRADWAALLALLLLLLWALPFALLCWVAGGERLEAPREAGQGLRAWWWASLTTGALVGCWLALHARRAWIWRRRRNPRPSREVQAERQRLARALHDAVGSQLVNASMLLDASDPRQRELQAVLENCLLDLRLLVDTMDGEHCMLADRLATLRHRLHPVLERRGLALHWQVPEHQEAGLPTGEAAQHIAAIVQEALSNALQHAHAGRLEVTLEQHQGRWHLRVQDDGVGIAQARNPSSAGNGLQGMAYRAARAGAQFACGPGKDGRGVCVHVHWPVPPARG